jgi:predicted transposase YdaD
MKRDDTLWKSILEDIFEDFLRFFYPDADDIFDFEKGFDFLDKELEELFPQTEEKNVRYVDKLVRVWLKNGREEWILIHVEVQGNGDKTFAKRMYIYRYRIQDRYDRPVVAWAILTDKNKKFHPTEYKEAFLGTEVIYRFNAYKVINQSEKALKASQNPFAIVLLTVLLALKKDKINEVELIDLKLELVKNLLKKEISKKKIHALMNFLKHYVSFNEENTLIFEQKLDQFKGKTYPMGIEQFLLQRAEDRGVAKGEKRGEKRGEEKGVTKEKMDTIRTARVEGKLSIETIAVIVRLPAQQVRQILDEMGIE